MRIPVFLKCEIHRYFSKLRSIFIKRSFVIRESHAFYQCLNSRINFREAPISPRLLFHRFLVDKKSENFREKFSPSIVTDNLTYLIF